MLFPFFLAQKENLIVGCPGYFRSTETGTTKPRRPMGYHRTEGLTITETDGTGSRAGVHQFDRLRWTAGRRR